MRRGKLALTVAMALAAGTVLLWPGDDWRRPRRLPDGSVVALKSLSFDGWPAYNESPPKAWQLAIGQRLPYGLAAWLGWRFNTRLSFSPSGLPGRQRGTQTAFFMAPFPLANGRPGGQRGTETNGIGFYLVHEGAIGAGMQEFQVLVSDDEGNSLADDEMLGLNQDVDQKGLHYHRAQGWFVPAFPRRGKNIVVQLFQGQTARDDGNPVLQIRIPNPHPGPHPTWTPEPCPSTKSDRGVEATLVDFTTGLSQLWPAPPGGEVPAATRLTLDFQQNATNYDWWWVKSVEISDATGNCWRPGITQTLPPNRAASSYTVLCKGNLWAGESAWKMKIEFAPVLNGAESGERRVVEFLAEPQTAK